MLQRKSFRDSLDVPQAAKVEPKIKNEILSGNFNGRIHLILNGRQIGLWLEACGM
jgi:hypothetical protein